MPNAYYLEGGGNVTLVFPAFGQIGPKTRELLELAGFTRTGGEFSKKYRKSYLTEEEKKQAVRAALNIKKLYNTGKREYTKELLSSQ